MFEEEEVRKEEEAAYCSSMLFFSSWMFWSLTLSEESSAKQTSAPHSLSPVLNSGRRGA